MREEEIRARIAEIRGRLKELDGEFAGQHMPVEQRSEWDGLVAELETQEELAEELRVRREFIASQDDKPAAREAGATFHTARPGATRGDDIWDLSTIRMSADSPESAVGEMRDRAMVAVERAVFMDERADEDRTKERLERLLSGDESAGIARHILATGSPRYMRAFGKAIAGRQLSAEEQRELNITTPGDGGYAVPFTLDPTVIATSDWSVNPLRALARVVTITGDKWKGLTSAGLQATYGYAAESTEASDNAPAFGQPEIDVEKAQAFVPFTIELQQDWSALATELSKMFSDARDDVEAEKFLDGAGHGSNEPQGLLTGATSIVSSQAGDAFSLDDVYALKSALPPRFRSRAAWVANQETYDLIRRFSEDESNNSTVLVDNLRLGFEGEPPGPGNIGVTLLGKPAYEASYMATMPTGGQSVTADVELMVYGDFRHFVIVDRIGMSVELIPHLMGDNGRPKGERGFYAHWRNSSGVVAPQAFRVLVIENVS